ncbi:CCGSCS motif protein [Aliivibrio kagoshimensis]|uniref:CCGSCS motif protein n=1 Tax=Aliivibrio kagoshimensis TaxID=2910230 RepID=UPI003D0FDA80
MAISFKKMFKKDDNDTGSAVLAEHVETEQATAVNEDAADTEKKKGKHGEPGFCCGSCS